MKKENKLRNILRDVWSYLLVSLGIIIFLLSYILFSKYENNEDVKFLSEVLNHIAAAIFGGGIVYILLRLLHAEEENENTNEPLYDAKNKTEFLAKDVAKLIFESSKDISEKLIEAKPISQEDYMNELKGIIKTFNKDNGGELRAVCGHKNWEEEYVQEYFDANKVAACNGAKVIRFFLQDNKWSEQAESKMIDQAKAGIKVKFIQKKILDKYKKIKPLRPGFGFIILNYFEGSNHKKRLIVHNSVFKSTQALEITNHLIIAEFEKIFIDLDNKQPNYYKPQ